MNPPPHSEQGTVFYYWNVGCLEIHVLIVLCTGFAAKQVKLRRAFSGCAYVVQKMFKKVNLI